MQTTVTPHRGYQRKLLTWRIKAKHWKTAKKRDDGWKRNNRKFLQSSTGYSCPRLLEWRIAKRKWHHTVRSRKKKNGVHSNNWLVNILAKNDHSPHRLHLCHKTGGKKACRKPPLEEKECQVALLLFYQGGLVLLLQGWQWRVKNGSPHLSSLEATNPSLPTAQDSASRKNIQLDRRSTLLHMAPTP